MSDFETLIRTMMTNGASAEDIAKDMTDILNKINKEKPAEDRKRTVSHFKNQFNTHRTQERECIDTAAAYCVLICEKLYPQWTAKDLMEFYETMRLNIKSTASLVGKDSIKGIKDLLDDITKSFDSKSKMIAEKPDYSRSLLDFFNSL